MQDVVSVPITYISIFFPPDINMRKEKDNTWLKKNKNESKEIRVTYFGSFKELVIGLTRLLELVGYLFLCFTYISKVTMGFLIHL